MWDRPARPRRARWNCSGGRGDGIVAVATPPPPGCSRAEKRHGPSRTTWPPTRLWAVLAVAIWWTGAAWTVVSIVLSALISGRHGFCCAKRSRCRSTRCRARSTSTRLRPRWHCERDGEPDVDHRDRADRASGDGDAAGRRLLTDAQAMLHDRFGIGHANCKSDATAIAGPTARQASRAARRHALRCRRWFWRNPAVRRKRRHPPSPCAVAEPKTLAAWRAICRTNNRDPNRRASART